VHVRCKCCNKSVTVHSPIFAQTCCARLGSRVGKGNQVILWYTTDPNIIPVRCVLRMQYPTNENIYR
jgi:hypothetical protein